jgi:hypothetical protein
LNGFGNIESINDVSIWQSEFVSTIQANLVRPPFDGEDATHVTVMTAERELDHPVKRVH